MADAPSSRKGGSGGIRQQSHGIRKQEPGSSREDEHVKLSKKMSAVLRHGIEKNGLSDVLRPDGYVPLSRLLGVLRGAGSRDVTVDQIRHVVDSSGKQRFSISEKDGELFIRANQGHSSTLVGIDQEQLLERLDESELLAIGGGRAVHGTYRSAWPAIISSGGLMPMARHHIHLAADLPGESGVISGMRSSSEIHIWVDLLGASRAGVPFFRSANGVILTPGLATSRQLPSQFFVRVVDTQRHVEWHEGAWQPIGLRRGPPPGSEPVEATSGRQTQTQKAKDGSVPMPPPPAPASGESDPDDPDAVGKKVRAVEKKLRQIGELKELKASGKPLEKNQLEKIEQEPAIKEELASLQAKFLDKSK
jgi:2'-phosphotransferase